MGSLPKEQNAPKTVSLGFLHPLFDLLSIKSLANLLSKLIKKKSVGSIKISPEGNVWV